MSSAEPLDLSLGARRHTLRPDHVEQRLVPPSESENSPLLPLSVCGENIASSVPVSSLNNDGWADDYRAQQRES